MLRIVSTQPFHTRNQFTISTFIPSSLNLFIALSAMDAQMVQTHKFTQSNPHWHPLISQLYVSLLFYIHILRCMIEAEPTNVELVNFYDVLYRHLGLESLVIPGPLVPFFAAITFAASPHEWIGNISPLIPLSTRATPANGFRIGNSLSMLLPSIPFILSQVHQLVTTFSGTGFSEAMYLASWRDITHIFTRDPNYDADNDLNIYTPNARFLTFVPFSNVQRFISMLPTLSLPTALTADITDTTRVPMSYMQYFGFADYQTQTNSSNWLTTIGPIMSTYSTFFHESTSLMSISPTGLGASLPIATFLRSSQIVVDSLTPTPVAGTRLAHFPRRTPPTNATDINHSAPNLSELAEQYAALAIVNVSFSNYQHNTHVVPPTDNAIRSGPYWSIPTVRTANDIVTSIGIPNNVATFYHSATSVRK
jgi:hypothetical protein